MQSYVIYLLTAKKLYQRKYFPQERFMIMVIISYDNRQREGGMDASISGVMSEFLFAGVYFDP